MIPQTFEYKKARTVEEALALLRAHGDEAKLLAGGHSLIPLMKLRLSTPELLIDIGGIRELTEIREQDGRIELGALVTHRMIEFSTLLKQKCPVLPEAAALIGDPQVRNKGTIGGSLAHADPAADYPAVMLALDAEIEATGPDGSRTIAAREFFQGLFTTALRPSEMLTRVRVPTMPPRSGAAYLKFPNPASRYAVVGVAAFVKLAPDDTCAEVRIGITGAAPAAFRATRAEEQLTGRPIDDRTLTAALEDLVDPDDLLSDLAATAEYRAHLCHVLTRRALRQAAERARS
ncbi:MAG: xanthine dehydrogenase family protein subunit M [Rhodothermus sp.]|nr:xanthine dehydrogenase family protein subunit M [Rhodothermus sp.]